MSVTDPEAPVHLAGKRSREAAMARDKEAWLALFADDAIVEVEIPTGNPLVIDLGPDLSPRAARYLDEGRAQSPPKAA